MGTFSDDVDAYLEECAGHFKRREVLSALMTLGKVGAEFTGAYTVMSLLLVGGGLVSSYFPALRGPCNILCKQIMDKYGTLDTNQRRAAVKVAGWARKTLTGV